MNEFTFGFPEVCLDEDYIIDVYKRQPILLVPLQTVPLLQLLPNGF